MQRAVIPTLIRESVELRDDGVLLLDRRSFPFERKRVLCRTYEDVARAIEEMVTQSYGPYFAAAAAMVLAARVASRRPSDEEKLATLMTAAERLCKARITNNGIRLVTDSLLAAGRRVIHEGGDLASAMEVAASDAAESFNQASARVGAAAASLVPDGATILTHCWGEHHVVALFTALIESGKEVNAICTETRPYLQGARLTAESLGEMGVDTTVITDNMGAQCMSTAKVSVLVTAADRVTMDGHVINKVGTLQLAIAANYFGIPYVALAIAPDPEAPSADNVKIEERDGVEVLMCLGRRTGSFLAKGYYPLFDVTPPDLVTAVATDRGLFGPRDLAQYFDSDHTTVPRAGGECEP